MARTETEEGVGEAGRAGEQDGKGVVIEDVERTALHAPGLDLKGHRSGRWAGVNLDAGRRAPCLPAGSVALTTWTLAAFPCPG